jgi:hypothetical protein
MSETLSDIKHMMVSRDTTVYIWKDKRITIENSLMEGGKADTYLVEDAKGLLRQIMNFQDTIPEGVYDELDKL